MNMPVTELIFLAFALSVDAFVVAFSYGLIIHKHRLSNGLKIALATGLGQFIMPILGFLLTGVIHGYIAAWDHWLGFAVFCFLGVNVILESRRSNEETQEISGITTLSLFILLTIGVATSIDAMVAGVSIYLSSACGGAVIPTVITPAAIIGITTFLCTLVGFFCGKKLHRFPTSYLELGAGLTLIGLGVKMLIEHTC